MVRKNDTNERYYCQDCNKPFRRYDKYQEHRKRHDLKPNICCRVCSMKFLKEKALKNHELHTHLCTYNTQGQAVVPFLQGPSGKYYRVDAGDIWESSHLGKKQKGIVFHCPVCQYRTYDNLYWEVHIQMKHGTALRFRPVQRWYEWKTPARVGTP